MSWLDLCSCNKCGRIALILTRSKGGLVLCRKCRKELIEELELKDEITQKNKCNDLQKNDKLTNGKNKYIYINERR